MSKTNKEIKYKSAVGLKYNSSSENAPSINIRGEYLNADQIVSLAKKHGVPVIDNPTLVKVLKLMELDEEIPEDLYVAVATLLNKLENI